MHTFLGKEQPHLVPKAHDSQDLMDVPVGESLGSFLGYLRRAKSSKDGLTAQVFGENGDDADFITTLHLTRFLNATVKVTVWIIKDQNGKLLYRDGQENTPATSFIGKILRPTSSLSGQTAQFFGENGVNADAVNILNESKYLNALVLVELQKASQGMISSEIPTHTPTSELEEGRQRLTAEEQQKLKKQQKKAQDALQLLRQNRFFSQDAVLRLLGSESSYQHWLQTQTCCQPGEHPCDQSPLLSFEVPGPRRLYAYVPLCKTHAEEWGQGLFPDLTMGQPYEFLRKRQTFYAQHWAQERLRQELNIPHGYDPTPAAIYSWAISKNLGTMIPHAFMAYLHE